MKSLILALAIGAAPALALAADVTVAAVSGPLASFASRLAGDAAEVVMPMPPEADPAVWRPGIAEITAIQSADLILLNGAGFAAWTDKTSLPRARTVVTSQGFEDALILTQAAVTHSHGGEGAHSHTGTAPQTWMDFALAKRQMEAVAAGLSRVLPGTDMSAAQAALAGDLDALDARARSLGEAAQGRRIIAARPGLEYFARAYGLDMTVLAWVPGTAPGPEDLAALDAALSGGPAVFLWQDPPHPDAEAALAERGIAAAQIDAGATVPADFNALMNGNLDRLEAALGL